MILKEFAKKYHLDPQELLDLLIFEKFPIQSIEDEIDDRLLKYLLEYTNKKINLLKIRKIIKKINIILIVVLINQQKKKNSLSY